LYTFDFLHNAKPIEEKYSQFDFNNVDRLEKFTGTHPSVMMKKVESQNWNFSFDPKKSVWKTKDKIMQPIEDLLGFKIGEYKNYKLI
jgi:hypothetical protein